MRNCIHPADEAGDGDGSMDAYLFSLFKFVKMLYTRLIFPSDTQKTKQKVEFTTKISVIERLLSGFHESIDVIDVIVEFWFFVASNIDFRLKNVYNCNMQMRFLHFRVNSDQFNSFINTYM